MSEETVIPTEALRPDNYVPRDWYWVSEDGRVYASARAAIVSADDKGLADFKDRGQVPTPWPKDADGQESDAELNDVLRPYGLWVGGRIQQISFREFIRLFTEGEQLAIASAAMADATTKLWYDQAVGAQFIDLGDPDLAAGMQAMVDAKLLTAARRNRVLKGLPPA